MEITEAEFATYRPSTDIPEVGRRVRILSCLYVQRPIRSFTFYEGTVHANRDNPEPLLNQIILNPGATAFGVFNGNIIINRVIPVANGEIIFPFDLFDINLYYWKYIAEPTEFDKDKVKRPTISDAVIIKRKHLEGELEQNTKRRLIFAGKSRRKTKKSKVKRRKTLKYYSPVKVNG